MPDAAPKRRRSGPISATSGSRMSSIKEQTTVREADREPGLLGHRGAHRHHRADELPAAGRLREPTPISTTSPATSPSSASWRSAWSAVIITGGIDLSVGSIMGLVGVVCGILLQAGYAWWVALLGGLAAGMLAGAVNGALIAYVGLVAFRRDARHAVLCALDRDRAVREQDDLRVRPRHGATFKIIGGGQIPRHCRNPVWVLIILTIVFGLILKFTTWGRHLYAIGGNEHAARLTGVPVDRVKLQAYIVSAFTAAVAAILIVGWQGSAINALGTGYELRVIASTVIGGANLMGGEGGAYGAVVGAALLEVIRNCLLMQGIDANWQGAFVGVFIVLAVLLEKIRGRRRA